MKIFALALLSFLLCCACGQQTANTASASLKVESVDPIENLLSVPRLYAWVETIGDEESNNRGSMWIQYIDDICYSISWPELDVDTQQREWPAVAGAGSLQNQEMHVAWRNVTGDADHAFYHAATRARFSDDGKQLNGVFKQLEMPNDTQLGEGGFTALLSDSGTISPRAEKMLTQFLYLIKSMQQNGDDKACPVMPNRMGLQDIQERYLEKNYFFCCESCKTVFIDNPKIYIRN